MKKIRKAQVAVASNSRYNPVIISPSFANYQLPPKLCINSNLASRNSNKSVIMQSHQQGKTNTRNDNVLQKEGKSNAQCRSLQKLIPNIAKDWNYQNEGRSVIISKNYGNQHNEVNVNISIMDSKCNKNLLKHHMPELIPPKAHPLKQPPMYRLPSRSGSTKGSSCAGNRLREAKAVKGRKWGVKERAVQGGARQKPGKTGNVSIPLFSPVHRLTKKNKAFLGEKKLQIPEIAAVQSESHQKNIKSSNG
eukprot:TRINITY_DN2348_c0_g1_i1.p1 TRINITY_DN2348_c0_g1~~TRINITY_DN2348_c0_g1_i1.p1  ORF type:complete len:249 (-),score=53.59 TRINITY_DN2348_c0_g1_i1:68-814(-)